MIFHDVMYMNKNSRVICVMNPSGIRIVSEIGLKVSLEIIFLLKQRIHQSKIFNSSLRDSILVGVHKLSVSEIYDNKHVPVNGCTAGRRTCKL